MAVKKKTGLPYYQSLSGNTEEAGRLEEVDYTDLLYTHLEVSANTPEGSFGFDPSLTRLGWCFSSEKGTYTFGDLKNNLSGPERVIWIVSKLRQLLYKFNPAKIYLEDYSFNSISSMFTVYSIGEFGGFVRMLFRQYCKYNNALHGNETCSFTKVPPTVLKKFVTGGGQSEKDQVSLHLYKRYGLETKNNDQADAGVLCIMGLEGFVPPVKEAKVKKSRKGKLTTGDSTSVLDLPDGMFT